MPQQPRQLLWRWEAGCLTDLMQDEGTNAVTAEAKAERILQRRLDRAERYLPGILTEAASK